MSVEYRPWNLSVVEDALIIKEKSVVIEEEENLPMLGQGQIQMIEELQRNIRVWLEIDSIEKNIMK